MNVKGDISSVHHQLVVFIFKEWSLY